MEATTKQVIDSDAIMHIRQLSPRGGVKEGSVTGSPLAADSRCKFHSHKNVTCLFDITIFIMKSPPTQLQTHCMNGERIMTSRSDACVAHTYAQKDPIKQENKRIYNAQMRAQQGFR
ncbi:predicted protein [Histoplasma capsulatum H143]|uniref:Uncharacterized protein n=1 Tax=Ajellomyces capsulatus (strain H143) TaxID=544712 RepID=C6HSQ7_AJECH|nr:predicted protein [Histoplasma capsulatum H143]